MRGGRRTSWPCQLILLISNNEVHFCLFWSFVGSCRVTPCGTMDLPWLVYNYLFGSDRSELKRRRTQGSLEAPANRAAGRLPGQQEAAIYSGQNGLYPAHPSNEDAQTKRRGTGARDNVVVRRLSGSYEVPHAQTLHDFFADADADAATRAADKAP